MPIFCPVLCHLCHYKKKRGSNVHDIKHYEASLKRVCNSMHNTNFPSLLLIWNLELRNDTILVIKHTLYLFHISFNIKNDDTILWWIYGTSTLSVDRMGDSYKDSVYMFYASLHIWHCIFSVSFRFPFRSVLVTPVICKAGTPFVNNSFLFTFHVNSYVFTHLKKHRLFSFL